MIGVNTNYVLDTNSLIMSLSSRNKYSYIWDAFVTGRYTLCVTNEILTEYEEVISRNINQRVARIVLSYFMLLPNVKFVDPHYSFGLIHADFDDARCIVTQDHHFDVLSTIDFPKVDVIDIDEFLKILLSEAN